MADSGTIAVPDLVGLQQPAAEAKLKSAGLVVGTVTRGTKNRDCKVQSSSLRCTVRSGGGNRSI